MRKNNIYIRYSGLLSEEELFKLSQTNILIVGCGVGSAIAEEAIRAGFTSITIVDGDVVEESNLGRQRFFYNDIGVNKAEALANYLIKINPDAMIKTVPEYLNETNVKDLILNINIVIDAIDPQSAKAIKALHNASMQNNIPILMPVDAGWGARAYIFNSDSCNLSKLIGANEEIDDIKYTEYMWRYLYNSSPIYLQKVIESLFNGEINNYPQPSSSASIVAGLTSFVLKKIALKQDVLLAPDYYQYDPELEV